jgi:hypothetical protein
MQYQVKKVKLSNLKLNPDNPRQIKKEQMERLSKSLQGFPEMLELREIAVDENMKILGGNMRYRALKKAGEKECIVKIVSGLSEDQKKEFAIRDNIGYGEWDMDILANLYDDLPLEDWGLELPESSLELEDDILPAQGSGAEKEKMTVCPKCGFRYAIK